MKQYSTINLSSTNVSKKNFNISSRHTYQANHFFFLLFISPLALKIILFFPPNIMLWEESKFLWKLLCRKHMSLSYSNRNLKDEKNHILVTPEYFLLCFKPSFSAHFSCRIPSKRILPLLCRVKIQDY